MTERSSGGVATNTQYGDVALSAEDRQQIQRLTDEVTDRMNKVSEIIARTLGVEDAAARPRDPASFSIVQKTATDSAPAPAGGVTPLDHVVIQHVVSITDDKGKVKYQEVDPPGICRSNGKLP
jgi:hypothetical protein